MVRAAEAARGVMIVGVDPLREKTVAKTHDYTLTGEGGRYLAGRGGDEILISR
jgi:hypothetical protein